ncbi:antimicrobial peptide ABC transporter ATPase [Methylocaldum marinum]|uniref:Antimicrobial peptide ABC transporter ATPase n=1 Tax=Methylocaldum marinum TaxID=1432792 RepID=A0A250KZM5_9GAMM|nr:ABC transporter ATP-binding protein [Methylocaldum marinum]BBA37067.1 antimicrobial peptide ABC transporter ATPase [Methylocaldum marinum]
MPSPLIEVVDLVKSYPVGDSGTLEILHRLNFTIDAGEFVAIMGPSGSGKSTLMNILGCLDIPSDGRYVLNGTDTARLDPDELAALRNRTIGFVFQGFNLLPRKTVEDNVALPLLYAGASRDERQARARELLRQVGLGHRVGHKPPQLSGGQQQRVAIARALANSPPLILADEPTGNLDTHTSEEIMALFERLNRDEGLTIVLVTHEPDVARHAQRLIHVVDGHIAEDGPVKTILRRAHA